ncbi:MAG: hypothetical protein OIF50_09865 [Flavobacteriaceae bacterium]|nr:hypothetical protein [Flavobacteriaceae bacterium]
MVGQSLEFEVWEDIKKDNHTDAYSWYDTKDDRKTKEKIYIDIDKHGLGETTFTIPSQWKQEHGKDENLPRWFYFKYKEQEFPSAFYMPSPNTDHKKVKSQMRIKALMLKVAVYSELDEATEKSSMVILGEQYKDPTKTGKECEPLIWGEKLTCDERKKVIEIAAALWGEDKKMEMANQLMLCMAVETGGSFDPAEGYPRATGLIQFTGDAIDSMNGKRYDSETEKHHWKGKQFNKGKKLTKKALKEMTVLEQLDYVQLYLDMWMNDFKKTIADALDMYMTIWCPKAVGMPEDTVCYSKAESGRRYTQNKSIDGETYDEKGEKILKTLADGKITKGELWPRLRLKEALGKAKTNRCKTDSSSCTYGTKVGHGDYCHSCKSIHVDLRDKMVFKAQSKGSTNCGTIARNIIEKGLTVSCGFSAGDNKTYFQLALENNEHDGIIYNVEESKAGIKYLDKALENGYALRAGVNHTLRKDKTKNKNINEKTTDHFVVIVAKKCVDGVINYVYWDVGTQKGESTEWFFELRDEYKLISDNTYKTGNKPYIVTQIAKVTKLTNRQSIFKIINLLILFFGLISCKEKSNLLKYELNGKTIIEVLENENQDRINFKSCEVNQTYFRFNNDTIYFQPHMDSKYYHIIESFQIKIDTILFKTKSNHKMSFIKADSITWINPYYIDNRDDYKTLYMDSLYLHTLPLIEEPCTECFTQEDCDQWEQEEKEKKERLAIEKRYDRFRDSIIKNKVAIDPKWHGTYQYDIADEGQTAGESSSVVTRDITITKDSVIIWDNGFMADFRINYLPVKSPKDTLYCFIDRDLNRRGQPKYYSSDLSPTKIYQSGKDYFFDSSLMTKRAH